MISLLNQQPTEKVDYQEDGSLDVIECFSTIQGEGPFAGRPAVFLRLAGCDLACPGCDTQYTVGRHRRTVHNLVDLIWSLRRFPLVVLTGGEPFRQNLTPLVTLLLANQAEVQIETNGTLFLPGFPYDGVSIVCSPKTTKVNKMLQPHIHHLKYIIEHGEVYAKDGLPTTVLGARISPARPWRSFRGEIWLQPMDSQNEEENKLNVQQAVQSCMKHNYRMSLQTHKILGLA